MIARVPVLIIIIIIIMMAGCQAPPSCTINPVTISTRDQITPATRASLRHLNTEIESQCGPAGAAR